MAQLVSDFLITPVLRQARRFSAGFAANDAPAIEAPALHQHRRVRSNEVPAAVETAILEGDEFARLSMEESVQYPRRRHQAPSPGANAISSPSPGNLPTASENPTIANGTSNANTEPNQQTNFSATHTASDAPTTAARPLPESIKAAPLPEDDGMGDLRRRIQAIQQSDATQDHKAQMMHSLFTERYTNIHGSPRMAQAAMRPVSPASASTLDSRGPTEHSGPLQVLKKWNPLGDGSGPLNLPLTAEDLMPTFVPPKEPAGVADWLPAEEQADEEERRLGCKHYRRNVKLQCAECERWYTCRYCHDAVEDHILPRKKTKHMLCMHCGCAQKASDTCTKCGQMAAYYYCGICKLWNDDPNKPIYHCPDCGLCRVGQGLGKDFYHCKKCMACISMSDAHKHKCTEGGVASDCPICGEFLFDSPKAVTFMHCGHSIHKLCYDELQKRTYKCPLCNKSCVNMEYRWRQLDIEILRQPMPPEYADARAAISCNDCCAKSQTAYHWIALKCAVCSSYNTTQLQLLNMPGGASEQQPQSQAQQPIALDPNFVIQEMRRRDRAARREHERQRERQRRDSSHSITHGFGLLSTSPSSYSPAFLTRFLNRANTPSSSVEPDHNVRPSSSCSSSSPLATAQTQTRTASATSPHTAPTSGMTATTPCSRDLDLDADSDEEEEEEEDDGMLDLFGARGTDFDRMTGLTSAESVVGFDDDDEGEEESSEEDEEGDGDDDYDDDGEEDEMDDILLLGHR